MDGLSQKKKGDSEMKQFRRGLAVLLAVLLMMPTLPAYAEELAGTPGTEISSAPGTTNESEVTTESSTSDESEATTESSASDESEATTESSAGDESEATTESSASDESEATTESSTGDESEATTESSTEESESFTETVAREEVLFNTGNCAFHVVDQASFENGIGDTFFAEDGSYTISIPEVNPFFPYEVQFTYGGEVTNQWFMTPDDSVEIGGHTFYVSAYFDDTVMTQLSLNVAGDIIVVYPEEKEFTDGDGIMPISLLPLEEKWVSGTIDLTGYTPIELSMISIDNLVAGNVTVDADDKIIWSLDSSYASNKEYTISGTGDKIDLSRCSGYETFELIVGEADQLAADNIRYYINANISSSRDWLVPEIAVQGVDGSRRKIEVLDFDCDSYYSSYGSSYGRELSAYCNSSDLSNNSVYVSLSINKDRFPEVGFTKLRAFEGSFETAEEAMAGTEITDQVFAGDMTQPNAGLQTRVYNVEKSITLVAFDAEGDVAGVMPIIIYIGTRSNSLSWNLYEEKETESGSTWTYAGYYTYFYSSQPDGSECREFELYKGSPADGKYKVSLTYFKMGSSSNASVTAAYLGNFSSIADAVAANAEDVRDAVFGSGYQADYSQGVYFSVFVGEDGSEGQEVYKYCFKTVEGEKERPVPSTPPAPSLSGATYLYFNGIYDSKGSSIPYYRVQVNSMDSYGDGNFYTFLVGADVDITNLAPIFTISEGAKLYAEGSSTPEESGKNCHDFSKGAVQYTVSAEDGNNSMNYWLRIIAPEGAGKLYMNSLDDPDAGTKEENGVIYTTRSVMLDSYHDGDVHNILLANIGAGAIPELSAELVSDVVKLDPYWTLKGKHELSGFTDISSYSEELSNFAKVALRAKEGVEKGTDVSGTLTLKSGATPLMVITLTGTVGNPSITTKEIPEAVKYVPYGTMIQNSNKYSWNKVTYDFWGGILPEGMEIKPNGELYGVPTETGSFTFTVRMKNGYESFGYDTSTFTLEIKDNTDENVDAATDKGYELSTRLNDVNINADSGASYTMVSQGVYDEFVDLYLDGVKLVPGEDYDSESGSTRITIKGQTLLKAGAGETGTHTLGIEFRTQDTDTLKRAAQNFNLVDSNTQTSGSASGNNAGGNGGSASSSGSNNGGSQGGSQSGSGTVSSASAEVAKSSSVISYTVAPGDSLWKIAKKFYGDGNQWKKIFEDNRSVLKNANMIYVGQVLTIYVNESAEAETESSGKTAGTESTYIVESGDSLWKIAKKLYGDGAEWRKIYKENEGTIADPSNIYAGQVLVIPE